MLSQVRSVYVGLCQVRSGKFRFFEVILGQYNCQAISGYFTLSQVSSG